MKIKIDENLPAELIGLLQTGGHEVHTVHQEGLAGRNDQAVFDAVLAEQRLFITQDLDFSDLRKFRPGSHPGVVPVRLRDPSRRRLIDRLRQILQDERIEAWTGCIVVISNRKLGVRRP